MPEQQATETNGLETQLNELADRLAAAKVEEVLRDPATLAAALREIGHDDLAQELEVREGLAEQPAEPLTTEPELVDQAKSVFAQLGYRPVK